MNSGLDLHGRHLLKEVDFTPQEWAGLLDLAASLKAAKRSRTEQQRLVGRNIALIFEKTSTRTRCAFEVAAHDQGGHVTYLDPSGSQIGHKESTADTARVLGRMFDGIQYRGFGQDVVEALAAHAGVPVWNGLTDDWHPTQSLADLLTMREHTPGGDLSGVAVAHLGDCRNNVGNSMLVGSAMLGMDVRIIAPAALQNTAEVIAQAQQIAATTGATITVTDDLAAVEGADFVSTDVWVSMGEPKEIWAERIEQLLPYQVNADVMARTGKDAKFLHCLPAFHDRGTTVGEDIFAKFGLDGVEVTHEVFEGPSSVVFDQAENRLHTIKAVMVATLGSED